jgi:hypothetical protein
MTCKSIFPFSLLMMQWRTRFYRKRSQQQPGFGRTYQGLLAILQLSPLTPSEKHIMMPNRLTLDNRLMI